jgi:hypothetical protein
MSYGVEWNNEVLCVPVLPEFWLRAPEAADAPGLPVPDKNTQFQSEVNMWHEYIVSSLLDNMERNIDLAWETRSQIDHSQNTAVPKT